MEIPESKPVEDTSSSLVHKIVEEARQQGYAMVPEADAKAILAESGIGVPRGVVVSDPRDIPADLAEPFVLKAVSRTLLHKSDVGGVRVGLTREQVGQASVQMSAELAEHGHALEAFLVEEMVSGGTEIIVGAVRRPGLGWVLMVGLGGVFVEVLEDVAFGIAPLSQAQITDMVNDLRGAALLRGARNTGEGGLEELVALIHAVGRQDGLLDQLPPSVTEVDLNPVVVSPRGLIALDARFVLAATEGLESVPAPEPSVRVAQNLDSLFRPRRIAVVGASETGNTLANRFIRQSRAFGFKGDIVPVHPRAALIEGLPTAPSLAAAASVTSPIDYAFIAVAADRVAETLDGTGGNVRFAQVISSGFSEIEGGEERNTALLRAARAEQVRILGPNCLGTHSSRGRITFVEDAPRSLGRTAVISQSGGLSVDILRHGEASGLDFHSLVSIGNGADVDAAELASYLLESPDVDVIGLYLESLPAARHVLDVCGPHPAKPIVLLAGGRTPAGSHAAASHTGALSGGHRLWPALARQGHLTLVDSLKDFITVLVALQDVGSLAEAMPAEVVLFGNGGGASVLASDTFYRLGISLPPLPEEAVREIKALHLPPGTSVTNPVDVPAGALAVDSGRVAEEILGRAVAHSSARIAISHFNVGIVHRNLRERHGDVTANLMTSIRRVREQYPETIQLLVLKSDGTAEVNARIDEYRLAAKQVGLPVFDEIADAGIAAQALIRASHERAQRRGTHDPHNDWN